MMAKTLRIIHRYGIIFEEPEKIEQEIETVTMQGWNFRQITTGGGGSGQGSVTSWVYLLFEREL